MLWENHCTLHEKIQERAVHFMTSSSPIAHVLEPEHRIDWLASAAEKNVEEINQYLLSM